MDDGLLIGQNSDELEEIIDKIELKFKLRRCEKVGNYVGIDIEKKDGQIKIFQKNYAEKILQRFEMDKAKEVKTPCILIEQHPDDKVDQNLQEKYREGVGTLLYLSNKTRPDISYQIGYCSRHQNIPNQNDWNNIKTILRYIKGTVSKGITYFKDDGVLRAYTDSSFADDPDTRKSTSGYVIFYNGGPVTWCSRKQSIVALSSTEAEFVAGAECCKELLYVKSLIQEITDENLITEMRVDNQSAIWLMKNGIMNRRSKHIDVRYHFLKEKIDEHGLIIKYCPTGLQLADMLTKNLLATKFAKNCNKLVR